MPENNFQNNDSGLSTENTDRILPKTPRGFSAVFDGGGSRSAIGCYARLLTAMSASL